MVTPSDHKPRVVMLVGNFVDGDSRVQKEARYAAAAGWDTYLVGRSPSGRREEYALGGATVVRAAETMTATRYRASHPHRRGLRGLSAYRSAELSRARHQRQRLRQRDLVADRELVARRVADGAGALEVLWARVVLGERVRPVLVRRGPEEATPKAVTLDEWRRRHSPEVLRAKLEAEARLPAEVRQVMLRALSRKFPPRYRELLAAYYASFISEGAKK